MIDQAQLPPQLELFAVGVLLAMLGLVLWLLRTHRLTLRDSLLWILSTGVALVLVVVPGALGRLARAVGAEVPANALFALAFVYVFLNLLALTIGLSSAAGRIRRLTQEAALLRGEIEALRARGTSGGKASPPPPDER